MSQEKFDRVRKFIEDHRDIFTAFRNVRPGVLESCYRKANRRPFLLLMQNHLDDPSKCDTVFFSDDDPGFEIRGRAINCSFHGRGENSLSDILRQGCSRED